MANIYFTNFKGEKIYLEVSEEIAKKYRESLCEEWRNNAYENYYTISLDKIVEAGHDFKDKQLNIEELLVEREDNQDRKILLDNLKSALSNLTDLQRQTIHKLFELNMTQSEIAKEEGVAQQVVNRRVARIFAQLRKLIKKF